MAAIPEGVEVRVPLVGESKNKILQITMIRCADDEMAAGAKQLLRETREVARSNDVLDYLRGDRHVKALVANRTRFVIYSKLMEHQFRCRTLREPNAVGARLATNHFVSAVGKLAA